MVMSWWPRLGVVFFAVSAAIMSATTPPAALNLALSSQRAATGWQWPLRPVPNHVVRDFNPPSQPWLAGNRGIDLAGVPGEAVRSAGRAS